MRARVGFGEYMMNKRIYFTLEGWVDAKITEFLFVLFKYVPLRPSKFSIPPASPPVPPATRLYLQIPYSLVGLILCGPSPLALLAALGLRRATDSFAIWQGLSMGGGEKRMPTWL
jgi:hypothetical protein